MFDLRIHNNAKTKIADAPDDCNTREFLGAIVRSVHPGSKVDDWDLRDGPEGRSLLLDRTLEENQVRSHQDLYLVSKAPPPPPPPPRSDLSIKVTGPDGKTRDCVAAADTPTSEFLADLLDAFNLPRLDGEKRPIGYKLIDEQSQTKLDESKTLEENSVVQKQRLVLIDPRGPDKLQLEVTAPDQQRRHFETPSSTTGGEFIEILVGEFGLPETSAQGRPIAYSLADHKSGFVFDSKKTLAENGVVTGQHLLLKSDFREEPVGTDLRVLGIAPDGRSRPCVVAQYTPTAELIADLVEVFKEPKHDAGFQPIAYVLADQQTGTQLDSKLTLAQNGVVSGQRLLLTQEKPVDVWVPDPIPPVPPPPDDIPWYRSKAVPIVLALIALIACAALIVMAINSGAHPRGPSRRPPAPHRTAPPTGGVNASASGSGTGPPASAAPSSPPIPIDLSPAAANLAPSQTQQFSVSPSPGDGAISWKLNPEVGTVSPSGVYTAPSSIPAPQTVTLTATTSEATPSSASATISLSPGQLKMIPAGVNLDASESRQFTIKPAPSGTVQWSLSPKVGSISEHGVYTAPALVTAAQSVKVIANTPEPVTATVTLQPVAITTITTANGPNGTLIFTANVTHASNPGVTWSIAPQAGSISPEGVYTPAAGSPYTLKVTARSVADPSKFALVVLPVVPKSRASVVNVILNHLNPVVTDNQRERFSATVTGAADTSVTWAIVGPGKIEPNGTYIAPQQVPPGDHTIQVIVTSNADPSKSAQGEFILRHGYSGPRQGTLVWSGNLERNSILTISDSQPTTGEVTGTLPGVPVTLRINTPKCTLVTAPAQPNGWKLIVIRTGARMHSISIDWSVP